jgi:hypothetical protein
MAYCGHKKEDIEDTSMERYWKSARPGKPWNPWGQLPPPQRGGGGEEESCASYKYALRLEGAYQKKTPPKVNESAWGILCVN